jgi:hypothetical protein
MAQSTKPKNFRDGKITFSDGTSPTPLTLEIKYEAGDFSISNVMQGQTEVEMYLDRGEFHNVRKTNFTPATFSFTCTMTDLSDPTDRLVWDSIVQTGAWPGGVSRGDTDVWLLMVGLTIEGTQFGDSADHTLTLDKCHMTIEFAEGSPNTFTLNGTVYGAITAT